MSDQYNSFLLQKQLIEERQALHDQQSRACEKEKEQLRASYSVNCDPLMVLQFPVCAICYRHIPRKQQQ